MKLLIIFISLLSIVNSFAQNKVKDNEYNYNLLEAIQKRINQNNINAPEYYRKIASVDKSHQIGLFTGQILTDKKYNKLEDSFGVTLSYQYYNEFKANFGLDLDINKSSNKHIYSIKPNFTYKVLNKDAFMLQGIGGLGFYNTTEKTSFGAHLGADLSLDINNIYKFHIRSIMNIPFDNEFKYYSNLLMGISLKF